MRCDRLLGGIHQDRPAAAAYAAQPARLLDRPTYLTRLALRLQIRCRIMSTGVSSARVGRRRTYADGPTGVKSPGVDGAVPGTVEWSPCPRTPCSACCSPHGSW